MKEVFIDIEKCTACKSCVTACAIEHSASRDPYMVVFESPFPQSRINVEKAGVYSYPVCCLHCTEAACITSCPTGAMYRDLQDGEPMNWLKLRAPKREFALWGDLGLLVSNAHNEIEEAMHRTSMGNDADPTNLILACLKIGIVDGYAGLHMATDLQDIIFGVPRVRKIEANMGVLEKDKVNIAIHGHNPILSEKILEWAIKLDDEAKKKGAQGINVVGVCCTENELTMRRGVPMAAHNLQSELILLTGAVDAMVVDIQCIWPSITKIAECYDTKIITTESFVRIPGAEHVPFEPEHADRESEKVVKMAIDAFTRRKGKDVTIPQEKTVGLAGFSVETIIETLKKVDPEAPLKPVIDNIKNGNIYGAVGFAGCPSINMRETSMTEKMIKELLKNNVLIVTTGCTAHICAQAGLLNSDATDKYCGEGLKTVLEAVGEAAGLGVPLPPVWHMGSCVDNSRIAELLGALADKLEDITGGKTYVEPDPIKAAGGILSHIEKKRKALGI